jgi:hypothetical protein
MGQNLWWNISVISVMEEDGLVYRFTKISISDKKVIFYFERWKEYVIFADIKPIRNGVF